MTIFLLPHISNLSANTSNLPQTFPKSVLFSILISTTPVKSLPCLLTTHSIIHWLPLPTVLHTATMVTSSPGPRFNSFSLSLQINPNSSRGPRRPSHLSALPLQARSSLGSLYHLRSHAWSVPSGCSILAWPHSLSSPLHTWLFWSWSWGCLLHSSSDKNDARKVRNKIRIQ